MYQEDCRLVREDEGRDCNVFHTVEAYTRIKHQDRAKPNVQDLPW